MFGFGNHILGGTEIILTADKKGEEGDAKFSGVEQPSWSGKLISFLNEEELLTIVTTLKLGVLIVWYISLGL